MPRLDKIISIHKRYFRFNLVRVVSSGIFKNFIRLYKNRLNYLVYNYFL